jgi:predicted ribosome quality control (RQC) complex YloA/Tae2 family protein
LQRALTKASARVRRRADAVRGDLSRAESADELARRAQLFVAEAARAPRGAAQLTAVDWTTGEPREVTMKLDPARGAQEQIDALFRRARRLKEGARIARSRLAEAESILARLAEIARALKANEGAAPDLAALEGRARAVAPRDFRLGAAAATAGGGARASRSEQAPRPPFRVFLGTSGRRILVGRGAEKNDQLTFHVARPHDLWLHAKDRAGAHVIVALDKGATCPADLLVEAAHLAAHFSDARDEQVVDVQYTPRRYLRKPRGSAPGLVVVDREKVIALRRQDGLLRQLLEREADA